MACVEVALLALILFLAFMLRCVKLDASFWADEIRTYCRAAHGFRYAWGCTSVPLSYVLARLGLCLGDGEALVRLPSVVAGVAGVAAAYVVGKRAGGARVGLLTALWLAVSAYHVKWSHTARYYALLMLVGLLLFWALERSLTKGKARHWFAYVLACTAGALTHQTFFPVVGTAALGAGLWILGTRSLSGFRSRALRLAILALCTLLGVAGYAINSPSSLSGLARIVALEPVNDSRAVLPAPPSQEQRPLMKLQAEDHRLTPGRYYGEYFNDYFRGFPETRWARRLLVFLLLCGAISLWLRVPALAAPLTAVFVMLPVPFFLVDSTHFYAPRYFSIVVPICALVVAMGVDTVAASCGRLAVAWLGAFRAVRRKGGSIPGAGGRKPLVELAAVVVIIAMLAPSAARGLNQHYASRPLREWKGVARNVSQNMTPNDIIVYCGRWSWGYINFRASMSFYLKRYASPSRSLSAKRVWCETGQDVVNLAREHPYATLWVVNDHGGITMEDWNILTTACPDKPDLGWDSDSLFTLRVLGEPTTNLCGSGGLEYASADEIPAGMTLAPKGEAFSGKGSAKLCNEKGSSDWSQTLRVPIGATSGDGQQGGLVIEPAQPYTLSMQVRHLNTSAGFFSIFLEGEDGDGRPFSRELLYMPDLAQDWNLLACPVVPGVDLPKAVRELSVVVKLWPEIQGTLWLDNIQFEAKDHPTPFVQGTRVPHDEYLASLE
jgi:4-amino-4-deoxy-L-arabinose transferase-like glycosyltransferase